MQWLSFTKVESDFEFAKQLDINSSTVWKIVKKFQETGNTIDEPRRGRRVSATPQKPLESYWTLSATSPTLRVACCPEPRRTSKEFLWPCNRALRPLTLPTSPSPGFRGISPHSEARKSGLQGALINPLYFPIWSILETKTCSSPHPTVEALKAKLVKECAAIP